MNYLSAEGLAKSFGEKILFKDLSIYLNEGDKVALIARNGSGKSSLLKILAGEEVPEAGGRVSIHKDIIMAYLPQKPEFPENKRVIDALFETPDPGVQALKEYEEALLHPEDENRLNKAVENVDALGAWDKEALVRKLLSVFKIRDMHQYIGSLSGGQIKRLALIRILLMNPAFLILDEPTNHLDIEMIEWLEDYLQGPGLTLLMVTHDRYFMERICTDILELEDGVLYKYKGSYASYLEKRAERKAAEQALVQKAKNLYSRELDWMRRMPKARTTKSKARIDSFYEIEEVASKKLEERQVELEINMPRIGGKIIEFHNVSKSYPGLNLFESFSYKFRPGEKVGIIGKNGTGKTSFLDLINNLLQPDSGKVVIGETVVLGYYDQHAKALPADKRALEAVREIADYIPLMGGKTISASQLMERFLFTSQQQQTFVSKLSGGEQRRLHLLRVLLGNPNVIILDEPTNDLDIMTLQVLENFLIDFKGCVIVVSHDRFFMDRICEHVFVFEGNGKIVDFPGNYNDYIISKENEASKELPKSKEISPPKEEKSQKKTGFKEKREFEDLEKQIPLLELKKSAIEKELQNNSLDYAGMEKLGKEYADLCSQLESMTNRWLELSDLM